MALVSTAMMKPVIAELAQQNGATAEAVKKWRQRGGVPTKHWFPLLQAAKRRRVRLSLEDFKFPPTAGANANPRKRRRAA